MTTLTDLQRLREASHEQANNLLALTPLAVFCEAAHEALGPSGCVTKLKDELDAVRAVQVGLLAERDQLKAENERLKEDLLDFLTPETK